MSLPTVVDCTFKIHFSPDFGFMLTVLFFIIQTFAFPYFVVSSLKKSLQSQIVLFSNNPFFSFLGRHFFSSFMFFAQLNSVIILPRLPSLCLCNNFSTSGFNATFRITMDTRVKSGVCKWTILRGRGRPETQNLTLEYPYKDIGLKVSVVKFGASRTLKTQ